MDIHVLNKNMELQGIVDNYKSIIWTTKYFGIGDFELYLSATQKNIELLREKYYLCREEDIDENTNEYHNVMVILNIKITTDAEQGNHLIVTGKSLKSIVGRRIVWQQTNLYGSVEIGIRQVIMENIISPSITGRKINNFVLGDLQNFGDTMRVQVTGDNIAEWVEKICMTYKIGWDVYIKNKNFVFYLYKGTNRSYEQDVNPYVVFSPEYDNLISSDYEHSMEDYKNVALVAGEGEGLDRKTFVVGNSTDLDRYELYVDARNVSTNNEEITADDYDSMLKEQGLEELAETSMTESFEGSIAYSRNYVINEDYFLGDIVQVVNEYDMAATCRITEIIDSEDDQGRTIIPTYSSTEV